MRRRKVKRESVYKEQIDKIKSFFKKVATALYFLIAMLFMLNADMSVMYFNFIGVGMLSMPIWLEVR